MAKRLSKKEKGFVRDIIKGKNGTRAALDNYDTTDINTAANIASENLRKPKIEAAIKSIADSIPDSLLIKRHTELLNKRDDKGSVEAQAVSKGLDMAYKLKGTYAPEKKEITGSITIPNEEALKLAKEYEEKLKHKL